MTNFDFPLEIEKSDFQGVEPLYKIDKDSNRQRMHRIYVKTICLMMRLHPTIWLHQAGKTWLRIYLEYYLLRIPFEPLITFWFLLVLS